MIYGNQLYLQKTSPPPPPQNLPSGFFLSPLVLPNTDPTDLEIKSISGFHKLNKH